MTLYVYIAQSLDGYIADVNGGLDWLNDIPNPDNSDFGFADFMDKMNAIVMGRNTFEMVPSFGMWPYSKPVYVISSTLTELPEEYSGKAEILNLKPVKMSILIFTHNYIKITAYFYLQYPLRSYFPLFLPYINLYLN